MAVNRPKRGFKCLVATALVFTAYWPAAAECFICDTHVELDKDSAACFMEQVEGFLQAARQDAAGRAEVNLKLCESHKGLDAFPLIEGVDGQGAEQERPLRRTYFMEVSAIECLRSYLLQNVGEERYIIDLEQACR